MAPRKYSMEKRGSAVEETRQRILAATLALHSEKGVFDTSWKDIAARADVSVATVYKHFPTLNELVPACGALIMAITNPPSLADAARILGDTETVADRIERLVAELFGFYERAAPYLDVGPRERQLPAVQAWEAGMRATRDGLVREALRDLMLDERTVGTVSALLAFPVFKSLRQHGAAPGAAVAIAQEVLLCWIDAQTGDR